MKRAVGWTLLGLGLFLGLLLVMAPAQLVGMWLTHGPLQLHAPSGSLWSGRGQLVAAGVELGELRWTLRPHALLRGCIGLGVQLDGPDTRLMAEFELGVKSSSLTQLNGAVSKALLTRAANHYDVDLQADLMLQHVTIHATRALVTDASGDLSWTGGHVNYVLNGQSYAAEIGPLHGRLSAPAGRLRLDVFTQATHAQALRFTLSADGWGSAAVTRQFMGSVGFPWRGTAAANEFVLEVQEHLF